MNELKWWANAEQRSFTITLFHRCKGDGLLYLEAENDWKTRLSFRCSVEKPLRSRNTHRRFSSILCAHFYSIKSDLLIIGEFFPPITIKWLCGLDANYFSRLKARSWWRRWYPSHGTHHIKRHTWMSSAVSYLNMVIKLQRLYSLLTLQSLSGQTSYRIF